MEYVESILSSYQWAALRVLLVQLTAYGPAAIRQALWKATEKERVDRIHRAKQLTALVHSVLTKELLRAVALAYDLYEREVGWAVRRKVLDSVDKMLTFYALLFTQAPSPLLPEQSRTLATTLLAAFHHHQAFTPHLIQLALRLARRVFPSLSLNTLFASFRLILQQEKQRRSKPVDADRPTAGDDADTGLAGYLLTLMGDLLTDTADEADRAHKRDRQRKRLERLRRDKARREAEDKEAADQKQKAAASSIPAPPSAAPFASSASEEKKEAAPTPAPLTAPPAAPAQPATHSVFIHYQETLTSELLSTILAKPGMTDVSLRLPGGGGAATGGGGGRHCRGLPAAAAGT